MLQVKSHKRCHVGAGGHVLQKKEAKWAIRVVIVKNWSTKRKAHLETESSLAPIKFIICLGDKIDS